MTDGVKKYKIVLDVDKDSVEEAQKKLSNASPSWLNSLKDFSVEKLQKGFDGIRKKFLADLQSVLKDSLEELKTITKYSLMSDQSVREMKLGYGLSSSETFAYDKALSVTGLTSMEDLMWASGTELKLFKEAFTKYTEYYEQTMTPEYVQKQLEYQTEMSMLKEDIRLSLVDFFLENKDTIIAVMNLSEWALTSLVDGVNAILKFFGQDSVRTTEQMSRDTSNIISNYANKNVNVTQTNNYNGIKSTDMTWLQNSTQIAYKQLYAQLEQG